MPVDFRRREAGVDTGGLRLFFSCITRFRKMLMSVRSKERNVPGIPVPFDFRRRETGVDAGGGIVFLCCGNFSLLLFCRSSHIS